MLKQIEFEVATSTNSVDVLQDFDEADWKKEIQNIDEEPKLV